MTWQAAFGLSLLIAVPCYFAGFVVRGMFPRVKVEEQDEQIHGDGAWPVRDLSS